MVEERITTVQGDAAPTTHTTVIHDAEPRRGSSGTVLLAIVVAIAVVAGLYFYSQSASTEAAKDNAVAGAAESVGDAADKVGAAVDDAVDKADGK